MDPYTFGLTLGGVGLGVMALSGFAQAIHAGVSRAHASSKLLALLSPQVAFSVLVGCGATGLLLRPLLAEPALLVVSLGGTLVTVSSGGEKGTAETTTNSIAGVIQTVLAAQLVSRSGVLDGATPVFPGSNR